MSTLATAIDPLDDLTQRFFELHRAVENSKSHALYKAMDAGDCLIEIRRQVRKQTPAQTWDQWLDSHQIPRSTGFLYIRVAEHRGRVEAEIARVGDLSLRGARDLLETPRKSRASSSSSQSPGRVGCGGFSKAELEQKACDAIEAKQKAEAKLANVRAELNSVKAELAEMQGAGNDLETATKLFRSACSLFDLMNKEPAKAELHRNEAIAAMHRLNASLATQSISANDVTLKKASVGQPQRKAA